jgi:hypothetical protein
MNYRIVRNLTCFAKNHDELAGEWPLLGIELADLQRLFGVESDDPMYECYIVGPEHVAGLQPHVSEKIDLERYDYFVDASGIPIPEEQNLPNNEIPSMSSRR